MCCNVLIYFTSYAASFFCLNGFGRPARHCKSPFVQRIDPTTGALLKSEHERRYPIGQEQAHPGRNGPVDNDVALTGARARNPTLSSLYALSGLPPGSRVTFDGPNVRGSTVAAAAVPVGSRLASEAPPARPSSKRYGMRAPSPAPGSSVSATPVSAAASLPASYFSTGAVAAGGQAPSVGGTRSDRLGSGLPGNAGVGPVSRYDPGESEFDALDMISNHDDFSARPPQWDDVLAAVSLRHPEGDEPHPGGRG